MIKYALLLAFLALPAMQCAPSVEHPALREEAPPEWTTPPGAQAKPDSLWWRDFNDPVLDSLISEALTHNYNLKAAFARLEAAAAQRTISGSGLWPSLGLGSNASRRKQNFIGFPIPGAKSDILTTYANTFGVSANVSWELDLWGRVGAARSAADAEWQATLADVRGLQLSLSAQTAKAYFAAVEARQQEELAQKNLEIIQLSHDQIYRRYLRGLRSSLDYRLSRTDLANARTNLETRRQQRELSRRQLELLLGRYPAAKVETGHTLAGVTGEIPASMPADLLTRRPDIVAAERRLAGARANVWSARAALFPAISLTASLGTSGKEPADMLNPDLSVWSLAANVLQPLFNGGRILAGIDLAKATQKQAFAAYANTVLNAYSEVETLLANENHLKKQSASSTVAMEEAEAARQLAEDRYQRGLVDIITLLNAQKSAYQAKSQWLSLQRGLLQNRIDLHLALGGGFTKVRINKKALSLGKQGDME